MAALAAPALLASHALLDTLTDGGLGAALLWPFNFTRYFAPWRPIPVAPIGLDFLSRYRPCRLAGRTRSLCTPNHRIYFAHAGADTCIVSVFWLVSGDPVRESVGDSSFARRPSTRAASPSNRSGPSGIRDSDGDVRRLMGAPLGEWWVYLGSGAEGCPVVYGDSVIATAETSPFAARRSPGHARVPRFPRHTGPSVPRLHAKSWAQTLSC